MTGPDIGSLFAALAGAIDAIGRDPLRFVVSLVVLSVVAAIYGSAAKGALDRISDLLETPKDFADSLGVFVVEGRPVGVMKALDGVVSRLNPILSPPIKGVAQAMIEVAGAARDSGSWPLETRFASFGQTLESLATSASSELSQAAAVARGVFVGAVAHLRGRPGTWAGWRVIGGVLFFLSLAAFLYADAGISIRTHLAATGEPIQGVPSVLLANVPVQFAVASFGAAFALGLVIFDLLGMTQLAPWETVSERARRRLLFMTIGLLIVSLALAIFISAWRADQLMAQSWLPPDWRRNALGISLTLPIFLLLAATALTSWGGVSALWLGVIALIATAIGFILFLRVGVVLVRAGAHHFSAVAAFVARVIGLVALAGVLLAIGIVLVPMFVVAVVAAAEIVLAVMFVVLAWWIGWSAVVLVGRLLDLQARATRTIIEVIKSLIDVLSAPVMTIVGIFRSPPGGGGIMSIGLAPRRLGADKDGRPPRDDGNGSVPTDGPTIPDLTPPRPTPVG